MPGENVSSKAAGGGSKVCYKDFREIASRIDQLWNSKVKAEKPKSAPKQASARSAVASEPRKKEDEVCRACYPDGEDPYAVQTRVPLLKNYTTPFPLAAAPDLGKVVVRWNFKYEFVWESEPIIECCYLANGDRLQPLQVFKPNPTDVGDKALKELREYDSSKVWNPLREHTDCSCGQECFENKFQGIYADLYLDTGEGNACICKSIFRIAPINASNKVPAFGIGADNICCIANLNWDYAKTIAGTGTEMSFPVITCGCQSVKLPNMGERVRSGQQVIPTNYLNGPSNSGGMGWNWGLKAGPPEKRSWGAINDKNLDEDPRYVRWLGVQCGGAETIFFKLERVIVDGILGGPKKGDTFLITAAAIEFTGRVRFPIRKRYMQVMWDALNVLVGPQVIHWEDKDCCNAKFSPIKKFGKLGCPGENNEKKGVPIDLTKNYNVVGGDFPVNGMVSGARNKFLYGVYADPKFTEGAGFNKEYLNQKAQKSDEMCSAASSVYTCPRGDCCRCGKGLNEYAVLTRLPDAVDVGITLDRLVGFKHKATEQWKQPGCIDGYKLGIEGSYSGDITYIAGGCNGGDAYGYGYDTTCYDGQSPKTGQRIRNIDSYDINQIPWAQNTCGADKCNPGVYKFTLDFMNSLLDDVESYKVSELNPKGAPVRWVGPCHQERNANEQGSFHFMSPKTIDAGSLSYKFTWPEPCSDKEREEEKSKPKEERRCDKVDEDLNHNIVLTAIVPNNVYKSVKFTEFPNVKDEEIGMGGKDFDVSICSDYRCHHLYANLYTSIGVLSGDFTSSYGPWEEAGLMPGVICAGKPNPDYTFIKESTSQTGEKITFMRTTRCLMEASTSFSLKISPIEPTFCRQYLQPIVISIAHNISRPNTYTMCDNVYTRRTMIATLSEEEAIPAQ
ncbi:MAG: hypothetical protein RR382_00680 [Tannerellaceae bacterium]